MPTVVLRDITVLESFNCSRDCLIDAVTAWVVLVTMLEKLRESVGIDLYRERRVAGDGLVGLLCVN